jgi:hypothetical protein
MRKPDVIIGGVERPYLQRWWVWPRNRWLNLYLHNFNRDDDDRALHDHPWSSLSILLRGGYYEITAGPDGTLERRWRRPGRLVLRLRPSAAHRLELRRDAAGRTVPCWTLFLTGPVVRRWGFLCPRGWVHWRDFTAPDPAGGSESGLIGRGCDE